MIQLPLASLERRISSMLGSGAFAAGLLLVCVESTADQCPECRTSGFASFDFPVGLLEAQISAQSGDVAYVNAIDAFEIIGVAPANDVSCKVQMTVQGTLARALPPYVHWPGGHLFVILSYRQLDRQGETVRVLENSSNLEVLNVTEVVELPIVIKTGTQFVVEFDLSLWTQSPVEESSVRGTFRFVDLPPGASIRSCRGYVQEPVPVQEQTWTWIKHLYRN